MATSPHKEDSPLPLSELRRWVSDETFKWLQEAEVEAEALKAEMEDEAHQNVANLFGNDSDDDDSDDETAANKKSRVQKWSSSATNPNGFGGYNGRDDDDGDDGVNEEGLSEEGTIKITFILSDSWQGFGDIVWASARHVANQLANADQCRELLSPWLKHQDVPSEQNVHPLVGTSFLELGAGAGVPSMAAMHCGARVVCSDQSVADRVRTMAECLSRNYEDMRATLAPNHPALLNSEKARSCPLDWGETPFNEVTQALSSDDGRELFNVIVAADCCYMPWLHDVMLDSINDLMSAQGVAIIPFALHGNTDDADVWAIKDRAKEKGFVVEVLESTQLNPPTNEMDAKQGLVHTVRLSRHNGGTTS